MLFSKGKLKCVTMPNKQNPMEPNHEKIYYRISYREPTKTFSRDDAIIASFKGKSKMKKEYQTKILKNGEKRYIFDVSLGTDFTGKRQRTTISAKTVKEGREKVAKLRLQERQPLRSDSMTVRTAYDLYLDACAKDGQSPITLAIKENFKTPIQSLAPLKLSRIDERTIESWRDRLDVGDSSRKIYETRLSSFFNWCVKNKLMEKNPFAYIKKTKVEKPTDEIHYWTENQFRQFLEVVDHDYWRLVYTTAFYTGLRAGELWGLSYEDIVDHELHLSHTLKYIHGEVSLSEKFKTTSSKRIVPLPMWLDFGEGEGLIFPYWFTSRKYYLDKYLSRTDLPKIHFHDFRHSYVAMLISKGVDIYTISQIVGHADIQITMNTYGHLYPEKRKSISSIFGTKWSKINDE